MFTTTSKSTNFRDIHSKTKTTSASVVDPAHVALIPSSYTMIAVGVGIAPMVQALQAILRNAMRSFLTILGVIIGVAAVITMVTLGRGLTADVQEDIAGLGSDVFIIFPTRADPNIPAPPFDDEDIRAVEMQIPGVDKATTDLRKR